MTLLPREIWNSTIKYLVKMVEAPAYIINNDISLMLLVRSNLKTVLCIFDYDESNAKNHISIFLIFVAKTAFIWFATG
jgi:hypothetical protein